MLRLTKIMSCFITSAERKVKDSRGSGMYQSRPFWDKIGHAKFVGFRFFWLFDEVITSISISLIYSLTYSRKKKLLFWLHRGLNRLNCVTGQIRGDSKLRDYPIVLLRPKVVRDPKNSCEIMH